MREAWKQETYVRSKSFSSESSVKYLHVGRRKIQIFPPLGEQDQSNALPQGQQRQSNPHPMPCLPPPPYIDRCIILIFIDQLPLKNNKNSETLWKHHTCKVYKVQIVQIGKSGMPYLLSCTLHLIVLMLSKEMINTAIICDELQISRSNTAVGL